MKWYQHMAVRCIIYSTSNVLMALIAIPLIFLPIIGWLGIAWFSFEPGMDAEIRYGLNKTNEHDYYNIVPVQHDIKHLLFRLFVLCCIGFTMWCESLKRGV